MPHAATNKQTTHNLHIYVSATVTFNVYIDQTATTIATAIVLQQYC